MNKIIFALKYLLCMHMQPCWKIYLCHRDRVIHRLIHWLEAVKVHRWYTTFLFCHLKRCYDSTILSVIKIENWKLKTVSVPILTLNLVFLFHSGIKLYDKMIEKVVQKVFFGYYIYRYTIQLKREYMQLSDKYHVQGWSTS